MKRSLGPTTLILKHGDLTREAVDAVVNAANPRLRGGGGVDGALHAAGGPEILADCRRVIPDGESLPPGEAVLTTSGRLSAGAVIHTVGPVWRGGGEGEDGILAACYRHSLGLAARSGLRRVAFPAISTGVYGYPFERACEVSLRALIDWCRARPGALDEIRLVYFAAGELRTAGELLARLLDADSEK